MKSEKTNKPEENKKDDNTFIYAAFLFGSLILGTILVILKLFGLFWHNKRNTS